VGDGAERSCRRFREGEQPSAIGDVYRQRAAAEYHEKGRFDALTRKTLMLSVALAALPHGIGIVFAPGLFSWIFGAEWHEAGIYASVLMVGTFFVCITTPIENAIYICQRGSFNLLWNISQLIGVFFIVFIAYIHELSPLGFIWFLVVLRIIVYLTALLYALYLS
jgi:teichuronic acid exporter